MNPFLYLLAMINNYFRVYCIEEIDKYHRKTLMLSVQQANKYEEEYLIKTRRQKNRAIAIKEEHEKNVREAANKIRFD